jgi:hypothetical protein
LAVFAFNLPTFTVLRGLDAGSLAFLAAALVDFPPVLSPLALPWPPPDEDLDERFGLSRGGTGLGGIAGQQNHLSSSRHR